MKKLFASKKKEMPLNVGDIIKDEIVTGKVVASPANDPWKVLDLKFVKKESYRTDPYGRVCKWVESQFGDRPFIVRIDAETITVRVKLSK